MRFFIALIAVIVLIPLNSNIVWAAGGETEPPAVSVEKEFDAGRVAVYGGRYDQAIALMKKVVDVEPKNADAHNYLGFSYRKTDRLKLAAASYRTALSINPKHILALEYQGELFLRLHDLNSARGNLARLEEICGKNCKEKKELAQAIDDYLSNQGAAGNS